MYDDFIRWIPGSLVVFFMLASVADEFLRDRAAPFSQSLSRVLEGFRPVEQDAWHEKEDQTQTLTLGAEPHRFVLHFTFEGRHGVRLWVSKSGVPQGYALNPVTSSTIEEEITTALRYYYSITILQHYDTTSSCEQER